MPKKEQLIESITCTVLGMFSETTQASILKSIAGFYREKQLVGSTTEYPVSDDLGVLEAQLHKQEDDLRNHQELLTDIVSDLQTVLEDERLITTIHNILCRRGKKPSQYTEHQLPFDLGKLAYPAKPSETDSYITYDLNQQQPTGIYGHVIFQTLGENGNSTAYSRLSITITTTDTTRVKCTFNVSNGVYDHVYVEEVLPITDLQKLSKQDVMNYCAQVLKKAVNEYQLEASSLARIAPAS